MSESKMGNMELCSRVIIAESVKYPALSTALKNYFYALASLQGATGTPAKEILVDRVKRSGRVAIEEAQHIDRIWGKA